MAFTLPLWLVFICGALMLVGFATVGFFTLLIFASKEDGLKPNEIPAHWM